MSDRDSQDHSEDEHTGERTPPPSTQKMDDEFHSMTNTPQVVPVEESDSFQNTPKSTQDVEPNDQTPVREIFPESKVGEVSDSPVSLDESPTDEQLNESTHSVQILNRLDHAVNHSNETTPQKRHIEETSSVETTPVKPAVVETSPIKEESSLPTPIKETPENIEEKVESTPVKEIEQVPKEEPIKIEQPPKVDTTEQNNVPTPVKEVIITPMKEVVVIPSVEETKSTPLKEEVVVVKAQESKPVPVTKAPETKGEVKKSLGISSEKMKKLFQEEKDALLPRMFDYVDYYADSMPNVTALIEYDTKEVVSWSKFAQSSRAFAAKLYSLNIKKGDVIATQLPNLKEHIYLMYACMRIGAIMAPLDLRLKGNELSACFDKIKPRVFFHLGKTPRIDFCPIVEEVMVKHHVKNGGSCEFWVQFQKETTGIIKGSVGMAEFVAGIVGVVIKNYLAEQLGWGLLSVENTIKKRDPVFIIFTTGSTGQMKAALMCHENILIQNIGLKVAFWDAIKDKPSIMLVNLPASHVGCLTEQLATTIYAGGVSVLLHVFDAEKSLDAIQKYRINAFGQIPALFEMQWRLPNYSQKNISSLAFALYGGQAVTKKFLDKLSTMAPMMGSGLGLTEAAGFVTYTPLDGTSDDILASLGHASPLCPISVREPMDSNGKAGAEKKSGEIGEICFKGPQIFLGYYNDPEQTKNTVSSDGWLYTGDIGSYDESGLHFASRRKFIIKPKGYQVFPPEIEDYIHERMREDIVNIGVIGVKHEIYSEAVVACIEGKDGKVVTLEDVEKVCKEMAAYKRPTYVVAIPQGQFPLNRVGKSDYPALMLKAEGEIDQLRQSGKWDK
jgi:fatty-acyl-CoA synthase